MMRKMPFLLLLATLLLSINGFAEPLKLPDLSGQWVLDVDESDNPKAMLGKSMEIFDPSALKIVDTGRGPVAMGRYIRKPSEEKLDAAYAFLNSVVPLNAIVSIDHQDPRLTLTYDDGRVRTVYTDERDSAATVQSTAIDRDQRLVFSAWEEGRVVIESNTTSGTEVLENLSLIKNKDEPLTLHVLIVLQSTRHARPVQFNYFYQLAPSNPSS